MRRLVVLVIMGWAASAFADAVEQSAEPAPASDPVQTLTQPGARVLTLREALGLAREHSPSLRRARSLAEAAAAHVGVARAPLLPQLVGSASYQRTTANFVPRPGSVPQALTGNRPAPTFDTFNFYSLGATATQVVYDFGVLSGGLSAAKENARAQRELSRAALLDVDLAVRSAFFRARASKARLGVAQAGLANQKHHLEQAALLVEVGKRPPIDVAQARTLLANAEVAQIRAASDYALARAQLTQALGVEVQGSYEVSDEQLSALPSEQAPAQDLLSTAFEQRADLAALDRQLRAQAVLERGAKGAYGPSLSVSSTVSDAGGKLDELVWNWNAGVLLTWPLLSGGATLSQAREARALGASIAAQRDALRQQVRTALEQAQRDIATARALIEAADHALEAARQALEMAEARYEAGVGNLIELGDAQLAHSAAEAQRVDADYELSLSRAILINALGQAE